jgi:hypothetical protein
MELLVKPEILTWYIYGPKFGNAERWVQQIQLRTEGRQNGDLGAVAP